MGISFTLIEFQCWVKFQDKKEKPALLPRIVSFCLSQLVFLLHSSFLFVLVGICLFVGICLCSLIFAFFKWYLFILFLLVLFSTCSFSLILVPPKWNLLALLWLPSYLLPGCVLTKTKGCRKSRGLDFSISCSLALKIHSALNSTKEGEGSRESGPSFK